MWYSVSSGKTQITERGAHQMELLSDRLKNKIVNQKPNVSGVTETNI